MLDQAAIDAAMLGLLEHDEIPMGTLKKMHRGPRGDQRSPASSKWSAITEGNALYFSRSPIPFILRGRRRLQLTSKHIGLYVYRRDFLLSYPDLTVGPLEQAGAAGTNCAPSKTDTRYV